MVQYLAKRIGRSVLTLFIIVTLVFCLLRLMPVEGYFANYEKMSEAQIQAGLQAMGLLDPLPVQVGRFWKNALHGDLGVSHIYKVNAPVTQILAQKLPISVQMGVLAMLLSLVLGIPLGLVMGQYKGRWPDKLGTALIVLIQAVPAAVYFLYIQMYGTAAVGVGLLFNAANWRYWVLPVCSMSLANLAFYHRRRSEHCHQAQQGVGRECHYSEHRCLFRCRGSRSHLHLASHLHPSGKVSRDDDLFHQDIHGIGSRWCAWHSLSDSIPQIFRERHARQVSVP